MCLTKGRTYLKLSQINCKTRLSPLFFEENACNKSGIHSLRYLIMFSLFSWTSSVYITSEFRTFVILFISHTFVFFNLYRILNDKHRFWMYDCPHRILIMRHQFNFALQLCEPLFLLCLIPKSTTTLVDLFSKTNLLSIVFLLIDLCSDKIVL